MAPTECSGDGPLNSGGTHQTLGVTPNFGGPHRTLEGKSTKTTGGPTNFSCTTTPIVKFSRTKIFRKQPHHVIRERLRSAKLLGAPADIWGGGRQTSGGPPEVWRGQGGEFGWGPRKIGGWVLLLLFPHVLIHTQTSNKFLEMPKYPTSPTNPQQISPS